MASTLRTHSFRSLVDSFKPYLDELKAFHKNARDNTDSFDNAVAALAYHMLIHHGGTKHKDSDDGSPPSRNTQMRISLGMLKNLMGQLLFEELDMFWLEDLLSGGYIAHTPHGTLILGANRALFQSDLDDAKAAIFSSNRSVGMRVPSLSPFDIDATVNGAKILFFEDIVSSDHRYTIKRLSDYEVMVEGPGGLKRTVSLLTQFTKGVGDIDDVDDYMTAWNDLSTLINMHLENESRALERKSSMMAEDAALDHSALAKNLVKLGLIVGTTSAFRENHHMANSWEHALISAQIDVMTDRLSWWLDLVPTHDGRGDMDRFRNIFRLDDVLKDTGELFCPVSYLTAISKSTAIKGRVDIEVKTEVEDHIRIERAVQFRAVQDYLLRLIGNSRSFDRSSDPGAAMKIPRIHVDWNRETRALNVTDRTSGHSAFAALDVGRPERGELERLASKAGFRTKYGMGVVSLIEHRSDDASDKSSGHKRSGPFSKFPIPGIHGTTSRLTDGGRMLFNAVPVRAAGSPVGIGPVGFALM